MSYFSLSGLLTIVFAAHNQYHVHPDDTPCLQPPCHTLEYFTNNSDKYFVSDTTIFFNIGLYYLKQNHLAIQNVTNVSLIGTPNTSDPTSPVSVIRCLPKHHIFFYNVTNLLINVLRFEECGCSVSNAGYDYHYLAATWFQYCTNTTISNTHIYNPVGYGIVAFNVMGNSNIVNVTVVMEKFHGISHGTYLKYRNVHRSAAKGDDIIFSIDNIVFKNDDSCNYDESTLKIDLASSAVFISIKNFIWKGSKNIKITIKHPLSPFMIYFYKCSFVQNRVTNDLIYFWASCFLEPYGKVNVIFDEVTFLQANAKHQEKK